MSWRAASAASLSPLIPAKASLRSETIDDVDGFSWGYLTDTYRLTRILRPEEEHAGPIRDQLQRQLLDMLSHSAPVTIRPPSTIMRN